MAKTVLIVEDNELNMKLFSDLLKLHGIDVLQSADGLDTLRLAKEHRPDLIIMDIQLPGISGLEHTKALKADDGLKDIPVLAVTALGEERAIFEAGCDGYISKPISVMTFLEEVKKHLAAERFLITDSLIVGHAQIDSEHKQIIGLINKFADCIEADDDAGCDGVIDEIFKTLKTHVENEERIMEELGYKHIEVQKNEHVDMTSKLETLIKAAKNKGYDSKFPEELNLIFVEDFFCNDMDFAGYLQEINFQE